MEIAFCAGFEAISVDKKQNDSSEGKILVEKYRDKARVWLLKNEAHHIIIHLETDRTDPAFSRFVAEFCPAYLRETLEKCLPPSRTLRSADN